VVHLAAIARRAGILLTLDDVHRISSRVPVLTDIKPAGTGYLEDLHRAGGVPALLKELAPSLELDALLVTGETLGALLQRVNRPGPWQSTIRSLDQPLLGSGALVTLRGTLAPDGAILKAAAATPALFNHTGPAVVFESPEDAAARIDDPALGITPHHVLVLRNGGPVAAGMPEAGSLPIPKYLAQQGLKDIVRVSDARMSGTAFGTVILHCAPEAAIGGPLAFVRNGDHIRLDVSARRIDLLVSPDELDRRREMWTPPVLPARGWRHLYARSVLQADLGADLDFLTEAPLIRL